MNVDLLITEIWIVQNISYHSEQICSLIILWQMVVVCLSEIKKTFCDNGRSEEMENEGRKLTLIATSDEHLGKADEIFLKGHWMSNIRRLLVRFMMRVFIVGFLSIGFIQLFVEVWFMTFLIHQISFLLSISIEIRKIREENRNTILLMSG